MFSYLKRELECSRIFIAVGKPPYRGELMLINADVAPFGANVCVCEIRYPMRKDLIYELIQQGVDAWSGSHPPTKTLPFHGDIDLGRQIDVPANLQISFNC